MRRSVQVSVECFVNHAHAALAKLLEDPVMPERLTGQLNHLQNTDVQI
jgi:hypothetical protein